MKPFDAIVLAGGEGKRLGGVDKALLTVGPSTMLERVIDAVSGAQTIVCVGPPRPTPVPVKWTRESPPGGGPAPALAAGLEQVGAPLVVVLAVDVPLVSREIVGRLVAACRGAVLLSDGEGIRQPLIGAYVTDLLREHLERFPDLHGMSINRVIEGMNAASIDEPAAARDCDTWLDLDAIRKGASGG